MSRGCSVIILQLFCDKLAISRSKLEDLGCTEANILVESRWTILQNVGGFEVEEIEKHGGGEAQHYSAWMTNTYIVKWKPIIPALCETTIRELELADHFSIRFLSWLSTSLCRLRQLDLPGINLIRLSPLRTLCCLAPAAQTRAGRRTTLTAMRMREGLLLLHWIFESIKVIAGCTSSISLTIVYNLRTALPRTDTKW